MNERDANLGSIAYDLCQEVRKGDWNHVLDKVPNRQPAASDDIIRELERRSPGFSKAEYQQAIAKGMFESLF